MLPHNIAILLATGIITGFGSGLLGVGGAFLMTPVQYMVFTNMGISSSVAIKMAFGTSLLVILPTAISGTWRHHKEGMVWWRAAITMGICGSLAAYGGATLAASLPGNALKIAFGVLILVSAIRMVIPGKPAIEKEPKDRFWLWIACAVPIGLITGILGIGGGVLFIPVLRMILRIRMHNVVAISLATMIFTSIGGVIGYIVNGWNAVGLPSFSLGYVNLTAWMLLASTSVCMAQVGSVVSQHIRGRYLRYTFAGIMVVLGLRMISVF